jgi:excisionase family DNA binding protein
MLHESPIAPDVLSVSEAATSLKVSPSTIRRLVASGEIPALRVGRGERAPIRIVRGDLADFLVASSSERES